MKIAPLVEVGQIWREASRSRRTFRVMEIDGERARILTLTTTEGVEIPSYLQRTGYITVRNFNGNSRYVLVEEQS